MIIRIRQLLMLLTVFLLLQTLPAFEWPVADVGIISTFGQDRWGDYLKGVELYSPDGQVRPVEPGELIFSAEGKRSGPHRIVSGLGNMAVLQHERGIRSVYGHLLEPVDRVLRIIRGNEIFGTLGSSGMVEGDFLYLQIIDSEVSRFVNPLLSLPSIADDVNPSIEGITLYRDGISYNLRQGIRVKQGVYSVNLNVFDQSTAVDLLRTMSVYTIKFYINGEEKHALSFESLMTEEWRSVPSGRSDLHHQALYTDPGEIFIGTVELQPGAAALEVVAGDFAGNVTTRAIRLQVDPE